MKLRHRLLSLFIILLLFPVINIANAEPPAPLRIGYLTDLVGTGAFFGTQSIRGALLAERDLKKSGNRVRVLIEDTQGNPPQAVTAVMKLIETDKVQAVICDLTPICTAIAPKVKAAGIPLIYNSPSVSIEKSYNYSYRNFIDYISVCGELARGIKDKGIAKLAGLLPNLEFGELCYEGMKKELGEFETYRYNSGDDLRTAVTLLKAKRVTGVVHVGYEKDFLAWFKLSREQQFLPLQGFIEIMLSETLRKEAPDLIEGALMIGYQEIPKEFVERLDKEFPGKGDFNLQGAALAYNAVTLLAEAFGKCPQGEAECVDKELRKPREDLLLGFRGFLPDTVPYPQVLKRFAAGKVIVLKP